ncbi:hypothetical protein QRE66_01975 [Bacillus cereus]|nr:hypothetical protein QRE66_01975 [Bacillus cereus]
MQFYIREKTVPLKIMTGLFMMVPFGQVKRYRWLYLMLCGQWDHSIAKTLVCVVKLLIRNDVTL